jgi:putative endonuclease
VARTARVRLGDAGERFAERSLSEKGWAVVARKWRGDGGEVDLVALDGDILVFVEVKTRRGAGYGAAEEAVDGQKCERLLSLGEQFVASNPTFASSLWRVDIVAITLDSRGHVARVNHIEDACQSG